MRAGAAGSGEWGLSCKLAAGGRRRREGGREGGRTGRLEGRLASAAQTHTVRSAVRGDQETKEGHNSIL